MKRIWIYVLGLLPLAFFYEPLKKAAANGWIFLVFAVVYLLFVRLVAEKLGR